MRRRGLLGLSLLAAGLTLAAGLLLWQAVGLSSVSQVSAQVEGLKPLAGAIRLGLIVSVAALWPRLVERAHRSGRIGPGRRDRLLAQRWRLVGWLLALELVLGQGLIGRVLALTTGGLA